MKFLKAKIEKPLTFSSCGHFISDENWIHDKRIIDSFEIIIGIGGKAYIQQDEERYEITPGNVLLLLPGHLHKGFDYSKENTSFYWMHFHCQDEHSFISEKEVINEILPLNSNKGLIKLDDSILIPIFSSIENIEKLIISFRQLLHVSHSNYYTPLITDYLTTLVLTELSQQTINNVTQIIDNTNVSNKKFISVLEWIRINIDKEISVQELADRFNFNPDYLTRLFKKHVGMSTIQYINDMKIAKAKEFLCQSENGIKEIAFNLGFKDEKYFMKLFKEHENLTPSEYRNAYFKTYLNNK
jgi:AraC-like DNA-binding protein